jgi:hypothetical protein
MRTFLQLCCLLTTISTTAAKPLHALNQELQACHPLYVSFTKPSPPNSRLDYLSHFVTLGDQKSVTSSSRGLELHLIRPAGKINRLTEFESDINDRVAEGATVNSTFIIL